MMVSFSGERGTCFPLKQDNIMYINDVLTYYYCDHNRISEN